MIVASRTGAAIATTKPAKNNFDMFMGKLLSSECAHPRNLVSSIIFTVFAGNRLPRASRGLFSARLSRERGKHRGLDQPVRNATTIKKQTSNAHRPTSDVDVGQEIKDRSGSAIPRPHLPAQSRKFVTRGQRSARGDFAPR